MPNGHGVHWTWCPMDINGHQCTPCPLDTMSIGHHHVHWCSMVSIGSNGHDVQWTWCPLDMMSIGSNGQQYQNDVHPPISFGDVVHWIHLNGSNGHHWIQWTCPLDSPMVSIGSNGHHDVHWTSSPIDTMSIGQSNGVHWTVQWCPLDPMDPMDKIHNS